MKLIDADKGRIVMEITAEEWSLLGGMFCILNSEPGPNWEDSTGQADTAMTPQQFDELFDKWTKLLDQPGGDAFFTGKKTA